jgi:HNH endonuclease/Helix-turn-helix
VTQRTCSVEGCGSAHVARSLCGRHYMRWRTTGDPLTPVTIRARKPCAVASCGTPTHAFGLCKIHYGRQRRTGTTADPVKVRHDCEVSGCAAPAVAGGMCNPHYQRWYRTGDPLPPPPVSREARFLAKIDRTGGPDACWPWLDKPDPNAGSYGRFKWHGQVRLAHALAWELANGRCVPAGHHIDHECHNRAIAAGECVRGICRHRLCCNPAHLAAKTPRDHVADTIAATAGRGVPTRLTVAIVREARRLLATGMLQREVAAVLGVGQSTVSRIKRGVDTVSVHPG